MRSRIAGAPDAAECFEKLTRGRRFRLAVSLQSGCLKNLNQLCQNNTQKMSS